MEEYKPYFYIEETSDNVRSFVKNNQENLWDIFFPLIPFIFGLHFIDAIITGLYFSKSIYGFSGGELIANYFVIVLIISWHRLIILGPDEFVPMTPFKPKKHELTFVGVALLIGACFLIISFLIIFVAAHFGKGAFFLGIIAAISLFFYLTLRISFYFPAKAINKSITMEKAFYSSKGYAKKIALSSILASMRLLLLSLVALVVFHIIIDLVMPTSYRTGAVQKEISDFVKTLPMLLYFQPLFTVIGVTSISNYYLWAQQNKKDNDQN